MPDEAGLRERQKADRRDRILAAAHELFVTGSYSSTSMETIAARAEVGVATLYNYFGTKGNLLAELMRPAQEQFYGELDDALADPPDDLLASISALFDICCAYQNDWDHRDLLASMMGPGMSAEPVLDEVTGDLEQKVMAVLTDLILQYQKSGGARTDIAARDGAEILFGTFNQHFMRYMTGVHPDFNAMKQALDRHIAIIATAFRA